MRREPDATRNDGDEGDAAESENGTDGKSRSTAKNKVGSFFIVLFGLPFLAVGLGASYLLFSTLYEHYKAQKWVEVPARIRSLDLEHRRGSKGGTTYKVVATYAYTYGGRTYEGDRVGFSSSADNVGSWHRDTHKELRQAWTRGKTVPCYVDPAAPEQAVLKRDLRFGMLAFMMLFATLFSAVGGGIVLGGLGASKSAGRRARLEREHPDEPWRHNPEWASNTLSPRLGQIEVIAWVVALLWNAISTPLLFVMPNEVLHKRNYLALIGLIFPAVGAVILVWAVRCTARRRKYGMSRLHLETMPGAIGGEFRGTLTVAGRIEGIDRVVVELKCIHTYTTGSGKNKSTHHETLHQDKIEVEPAIMFGQTQLDVPFRFAIPADCPPCEEPGYRGTIGWKLLAEGSAPGVDLAMEFEVPVYRVSGAGTESVEFQGRRGADSE